MSPAETGSAVWQSRLHEPRPGAKSRFRWVISSVVERFVHIEDVGSSNLSSPTKFPETACTVAIKCIAGRRPVLPACQASVRASCPVVSCALPDRRIARDCLPQPFGLAKGGGDGRLAQLVERFVYTEDVGSSSLSSPTRSPTRPELRWTASSGASPSGSEQDLPDVRIRPNRDASRNIRPRWFQTSLTGTCKSS